VQQKDGVTGSFVEVVEAQAVLFDVVGREVKVG